MDIACPNCAATYRVPDALIDGANALRCVACGHVWVPAPPPSAQGEAAVEAATPPPAPEPPPPPPPAAAPPPLPPAPPPPPDSAPLVVEAPPPPGPPAAAALPPMRSDVTLSLTATRAGPPNLASHRLPEVPRRRRPGRPALSGAWAISIALVIAFVLGLVIYRAQISAAWPPFARLVG